MGIFKRGEVDIAAAYENYADMLYRLALSHLQNVEDAMDAVQDVFTRFISAPPEFNDCEHEKAWFIRVTVNRCYSVLRHKRVRNHIPLDEISELISEGEGVDAESIMDVMNSLSQIPEKCKAVVILHHLEGFSVEKTAEILGISVSAVKMRLMRGREALKGLLEGGD